MQKYPDGDSRRRGPGYRPRTSNGRGSGSIGSSVLRATAWKDLQDAKVVADPRRKGGLIAVDGGGLALMGSLALMALARFVRPGRPGQRGR